MRELSLLSKAKFWAYKDYIFATDSPNSMLIDAVFQISAESFLLARSWDIPDNCLVLDLCTGSGVLAILAASKAKRVIGVDISQRALLLADLNAGLNEVDNKTEWRLGDLYEPVNGIQFDCIVANPPFEPTPTEGNYYLHSSGGEYGTDIAQRIIRDAPQHLLPYGSLQIVTLYPDHDLGSLVECADAAGFADFAYTKIGKIPNTDLYDYQQRKKSLLNDDSKMLQTRPMNDFMFIFAKGKIGSNKIIEE